VQAIGRSARHLVVALVLFGAAVVASTEDVEASTGTVLQGEFKTAFGTHRAHAVVAPPAAEPGMQASWALIMAAVAIAGLVLSERRRRRESKDLS
jgi:hypothetical protein